MKVTITGSLGQIGKPLTEELVQKGRQVKVVAVIHKKKLKRWVQEQLSSLSALN